MSNYETTLSPPVISHPAHTTEGNENTGTARTRPPQQTTDDGAVILAAHCSNVADRAVKLYYEDTPQTTATTATTSQEAVVFTASSMHDFGKVTPQFQAHVRPDETHTGSDREKNHARLGALATWFLLSHAQTTDRDALAGTLAVARHHQALPNTATYTVNTLIPAFTGDVIQTQLDAINDTWPDEANELLQRGTTHLQIDTTDFPQDTLWEAFYEWASDDTATRDLRELAGKQELTRTSPAPENLPDKTYDRMLHYWGALTLADKTHASGTRESRVFNFDTLDINAIDEYVDELRRTPTGNEHEATLNDERERARRQAIRGVHEFTTDTTTDVATLTLPTGLGKTLTGLSAAFETRNTLQTEDTTPQQIIYALPHTSIIEQTRKLFENPELWGADPEKSALTVHHYLSNTVVTENDDATDDVATTDGEHDKLLGEAWRSGTILTTFVQLFESITGPTNNSGLKLSSLQNAVIILDEPQAISKHWWGATNRLFTVLTGI